MIMSFPFLLRSRIEEAILVKHAMIARTDESPARQSRPLRNNSGRVFFSFGL